MIIYTIRNKINGKQLIGQTVSTIDRRWKSHKYGARKGLHHNPHFQRAWNKYGEDAFVCELVAVAQNQDELNALEIYHIATTSNIYNMRQ